MKNFYLLIFGFFVCSLVQAQIKKGDIMLGGNVGYNEQSSSSSSNSLGPFKNENWSVNPSLGKAVKDNLVAGLDISYGHTTYDDGQPDYLNHSNNFGAGVFLRRYKPIGNNFYLFIQSTFSGSYAHGSSNNSPSNNSFTHDDNKAFGLSFQFYPGISYAINRRWQLETGLPNLLVVSYNHSKDVTSYASQPDQTSTGHTVQVSSALTGSNQITVGVRYFIGRG